MTEKALVYIQHAEYEKADEAVENIFRRFPLDVSGKLVWVKPNMLGDFIPERHVTTHPSVISALVRKLISLKARVVVGDNSGIQCILSDTAVAGKSGLLEASHGHFAKVSEHIVHKRIAEFNETVAIPKIADECDMMISVPKMKTHLQTFISGAVKNSYGLVVGVQKPNLHLKHPDYVEFAGLVARIYDLRKPDLVIIDGVYAMEGDGPNSTEIRQVNRIIASDCGVSADRCMAAMMGMEESRIPLLEYCLKHGIGRPGYRIEGDASPVKGFKPPRTYVSRARIRNTPIEALTYHFTVRKRVQVNPKLCKQCQRCFRVCPAGAISWDKYPLIDPKKCVLCFCCKEACQYHAINFTASYRMAQRLVECLNYFGNRKGKKKCTV